MSLAELRMSRSRPSWLASIGANGRGQNIFTGETVWGLSRDRRRTKSTGAPTNSSASPAISSSSAVETGLESSRVTSKSTSLSGVERPCAAEPKTSRWRMRCFRQKARSNVRNSSPSTHVSSGQSRRCAVPSRRQDLKSLSHQRTALLSCGRQIVLNSCSFLASTASSILISGGLC